jgi:RNA polymerase sigma-70 factor (ECF subfamily)
VLRIARNTTLDHLRSRKKWTDVDANRDDQEESVWDRLPDELPTADASLFTAQQRAVLDTCIHALPDEQREVLLLREEGDLTFREIADITNVSINTALGRMRYALINLRKMMSANLASELNDFTE